MTLAAGVDLGGTKIDACIADPGTGEVVARERVPTLPGQPGAALVHDCAALVARLAEGRALSSVGIGVCEFVDRAGHITSASTLDLRGVDVVGGFRGFGPATVESDVRAAALAEVRFGAGAGIDAPWLYVSVGTGISYSLVIEGRPFEGSLGNAIVVGAPPVEKLASGLGLARASGHARAEEALADPACADIVAAGAAALGVALATLINALDPALVVIGGGLGLMAIYRDAAVRTMRNLIEAEGTRNVRVVPAGLGDLAGPLGAALAGADRAATASRA